MGVHQCISRNLISEKPNFNYIFEVLQVDCKRSGMCQCVTGDIPSYMEQMWTTGIEDREFVRMLIRQFG